jgi:ribonuclease P protein component
MKINNSFSKTERLCSTKVISELFESGRKFNNHPLRIIWRLSDKSDPQHIKILISVPKKYFTKAIERNLIKRRIREAYRKNKNILHSVLTEKASISVDIAFIFVGKNITDYNELETKVISVLQNLVGLL